MNLFKKFKLENKETSSIKLQQVLVSIGVIEVGISL